MSLIDMRPVRDVVGVVLFLLFLALLVVGVARCTPVEANQMALSFENAAAVAQYDQALVECQQTARQRPREQRFEAYTDCEQAVSKHFCSESQELRREWPRCAELGFEKE